MESPSKSVKVVLTVAGALLAMSAITMLLWIGKIGEASFTVLTIASAIIGMGIFGFERLKEISFKDIRLVLRKLEQREDELFVREEKLKSIIVPLVHILAYTSASSGRYSDKESHELQRQWYKKKLSDLLNSLDIDSLETSEALKFIDKYEEVDQLFAGRGGLNITDPDYQQVSAKLDLLSSQLNELLRKDLGS